MNDAAQNEIDAAKRCSETINAKLAFYGPDAAVRWVAIRLSDGGSDGNLYDTKTDAIRHQLHETLCAYVCITPDGMSVDSARRYLKLHRKLYDAGARLADPETMIHAPLRRESL